jgi:alkylation response protein AidB-like acyl-CoA dehydrogenase
MHALFDEQHEILRKTVRRFVENEIVPHVDRWEEAGETPRALFEKLGALGFLGLQYDEADGGGGCDFLSVVVFVEELARCRSAGVTSALTVHALMATPPIAVLGTEAQKREWLRPAITGTKIGALGISEPDAGSDVAGIRTVAVRDGDDWIINGAKTFITNGAWADFITLAVKTDPGERHKGVSVFLFDTRTPGFRVAGKLRTMGYQTSGTAELVFENCRVPGSSLLGAPGTGFGAIMKNFEEERLVGAVGNVAQAAQAFEDALAYAKTRVSFGRTLASHQVIRHKLVEMWAAVESVRQMVYHAASLFSAGVPCPKEIAAAKYLSGEMVNRVAYDALQIHGGYGYTKEFPIERLYRDARVKSIAGGTTEIMKEIIAKRLGM